MKIEKTRRPWFRRRMTIAAGGLVALGAAALVSNCGGSGSTQPIVEANIDTLAAQVGGGTQAVALYDDGSTAWTLYTMANRFAVAPTSAGATAVREITVPGYIQHITVVKDYAGKSYALLSMGDKGIGVVDITAPATMSYLHTKSVGYTAPAFTTVDGGGNEFSEEEMVHTAGPVSDLLVEDSDGTAGATPGDQLYIANEAFGIQKTSLSNLIGVAGDGALTIDNTNQAYTLTYAGENPWGGPKSLKMAGGKLYAALGFLGMGIFNPADLTAVGAYNLYADCTYRGSDDKQEDWFGYPKRKIACPDASVGTAVPGGFVPIDAAIVDLAEGMPTYLQAAAELDSKSSTGGLAWNPWAEFDRYGKHYYDARAMDVQDVGGGKTMAYIAYGLGGLVAVDVTVSNTPTYAGFVPAAPAHGPDEPPINVDKKGILSHFGSGMLKEAGVKDVRVVADGGDYTVYYTDHFAGMVAVGGAGNPAAWKNPGAPFNNDKIDGAAEPRVFWPDYEFVTSYNMTPVPVGDESLPQFLVADSSGNFAAPLRLVTGEINGHGGALFLMPGMDTANSGSVDAVQSSGAGGVSFVDIAYGKVANHFEVLANLVSTNEVGAAENGSATQTIAIGHAEGVTVSGNHLYLADGPHGVSVWTIANGYTPIDDLHLVANTLQDEYATSPDGVQPTPHAFKVGFGSDPNQAYVMSQSLGMRRVNVSAVTSGSAQVGAPAILDAKGGIYEHNGESGSIGLVKVEGQDHAYGVAFRGKYAIVADGDNGLTVYDTTAAAGTPASVVANIGDSDGAGNQGKPPLGRAASVKLWTNVPTGRIYAVVAAGAYGISVVDMTAFFSSGDPADLTVDLTNPANSSLLKTFEPVKSDDDNAFGSADGKSVDVHIINDIAYFSYDSFGLVAYRMTDLIRPATEERPAINPTPEVCENVVDVTKLSAKQGGVGECRPTAVGYFKLQKYLEVTDAMGVVTTPSPYADLDGGALYMTPQYFPANAPYINASGTLTSSPTPRLLFFVGYGNAGVIKLDWSNVGAPSMMAIKGVVGGAVATAIKNGRVYIAAGAGGLTVLK